MSHASNCCSAAYHRVPPATLSPNGAPVVRSALSGFDQIGNKLNAMLARGQSSDPYESPGCLTVEAPGDE